MASTFAQIETLKQQLSDVSAHLAEVKGHAWNAKKSLIGARLRGAYYRTALALRQPKSRYSMWSTGVLIVGPAVVMFVVFLLAMIVGLPGGLIFWVVVLAAAVAFAALSAMLSYPMTEVLPKLIADERFVGKEFQGKARQLDLETKALQTQIVAIKAAIDELVKSDQLKRESLLRKNWKAMRDDEWELFLVEVFLALGASVEHRGKRGDQGADLIVSYGDLKIVVQAKGYYNKVNNKAVQEAVAAKAHYGCNRAAVITNSRFAPSAFELAASNQCYLIGEQQFPAFVMGSNLELFR